MTNKSVERITTGAPTADYRAGWDRIWGRPSRDPTEFTIGGIAIRTDSTVPPTEIRFEENGSEIGRIVNLGLTKPTTPRPESGPMQFGDDWPGVFLRGDCALGYAMYLECVLSDPKNASPIYLACLRGLLDTLRGADARNPNQRPQMARLETPESGTDNP